MRRLRGLSAVVVLVASLSLTSCTPEPAMTLDESKAQLVEILRTAQEAAGGEWDDYFDVVPVHCSGGSRERYALVSFGPGADDPGATAVRVQAAWEQLGYEVSTGLLSIGAIEVRYRDESGLFFTFWSGVNATSLDGVSVCVPPG